MRDLDTLKNFFSQAYFYQDNDEQMKKEQMTNKKYRTEEKVIAQNFTVDCCAVAPLHFYVLLLASSMLDSWKNCFDIFRKKINKNNITFLAGWTK